MNGEQISAIKQVIGNLEDDRYRYKLSEQRMPGQKTGNDEPFTEVIAKLDSRIAKLKEGL